MVVLGGMAVSYERGTPVGKDLPGDGVWRELGFFRTVCQFNTGVPRS